MTVPKILSNKHPSMSKFWQGEEIYTTNKISRHKVFLKDKPCENESWEYKLLMDSPCILFTAVKFVNQTIISVRIMSYITVKNSNDHILLFKIVC